MPIATKNNAIIVKDGNAADGCECCNAGACCEGTSCSVKPQSQCQGTGNTFMGLGTTCSADRCLVCGCVSRSSAPQKLYARFSEFSNFVYATSSFNLNPPRPSDAESAAAQWLNTTVVEIPATINLETAEVTYATQGCVAGYANGSFLPCTGCDPLFRAPILDGAGTVGPGIMIIFPCAGGFVLPTYNFFGVQPPRWWVGPAIGCEPSGLGGWITEIEILFSSTQNQRNWCSIAQGATPSFTLNAQTSFMRVRPNNFFVDTRYTYTGSGGTVSLSTNPLP